MTDELTAVYRERNLLAQLAARLAQVAGLQVYLCEDADEPEWPVLYIELPTGQVSWHISPDDFLWPDLPLRRPNTWDGHTTEEKYSRVARFVQPEEAMHGMRFVSGPWHPSGASS